MKESVLLYRQSAWHAVSSSDHKIGKNMLWDLYFYQIIFNFVSSQTLHFIFLYNYLDRAFFYLNVHNYILSQVFTFGLDNNSRSS